MSKLTLIVRPTPGARGLWDVDWATVYAHIPSRKLLTGQRDPLLAGARELMRLGYSEEVLVTMRHEGKEHDSFVPMKLGTAAKLTTAERDHASIAFQPYSPHPLAQSRGETEERHLDAGRPEVAPEQVGAPEAPRRDPFEEADARHLSA